LIFSGFREILKEAERGKDGGGGNLDKLLPGGGKEVKGYQRKGEGKVCGHNGGKEGVGVKSGQDAAKIVMCGVM